VQGFLVLVDVLDEGAQAVGIGEVLLVARALVLELDGELARAHQVGGFAQAAGDDFVVDLDRAEDLGVGLSR
jgi:hypothetical protein